jgi:outer membrane protein assembly factor BamB
MLNLYRKILFIFFIFIHLFISAQISYLSPVPNSKYHLPQTNILIRFVSNINNKSLKQKENYRITGSVSGNVNFDITVVDAEKLIVLNPQKDFFTDEIVVVEILNSNNEELDENTEFEFKFMITSEKSYGLKKQEVVGIDFLKKKDRSLAIFPEFYNVDYGHPAAGSVFFCNQNGSLEEDNFIAILDKYGNTVFSKPISPAPSGTGFTLQKNGYLTYWDSVNECFLMLDSTYAVIDTLKCTNGYLTDFHECQVLADNSVFLMASDNQFVDMSQYIPFGNPDAIVKGLIIQMFDPGRNLIFQWRSWDFFQITDATEMGNFSGSHIDYVHGNSIDTDSAGNIILSCRNMDEITKINTETGQIIWRLGGKNNDFEFVNDNEMFNRQHDARYTQTGSLTLFDNGVYHANPISSVREYIINDSAKTAELIWKFKHPLNYCIAKLGNAQRLYNGNTFINWASVSGSTSPIFSEVARDCTIVYEMYFMNSNSCYRGFRHQWNISLDSLVYNPILSVDQNNEINLFPNPANDFVNVYVKNERAIETDVEIFATSGMKQNVPFVLSISDNIVCYQFTIKDLSTGVFIVKAIIDGNIFSKRLVIIR